MLKYIVLILSNVIFVYMYMVWKEVMNILIRAARGTTDYTMNKL